jgi:streptomycin 6-kinase
MALTPSDLPRLAGECAEQWSLSVGEPFVSSATALVVPVRRDDGGAAVLKVQCPHRESEHEAEALAQWGGHGAVRLLAVDPDGHAFLVERCEPGQPLATVVADDAVGVMIDLLPRLWKAAGPPFRTLVDEAAHWTRSLPDHFERAGRPFERGLVDAAVDQMRILAATQGDQVLVHQDLHAGNVLKAQRQPWLVIDPKPLVGEREFAVAPAGWTVAQTMAWAFDGDTVIAHHVAVARWLIGDL